MSVEMVTSIDKPVKNKVRIEQLEAELNRTRQTLFTTESRLVYTSRDLEGTKQVLESLRQARREDNEIVSSQQRVDAQIIRDLRAKVENLNTQLVTLSSILNAAKTVVVGALPQAPQGLGDMLASVLRPR